MGIVRFCDKVWENPLISYKAGNLLAMISNIQSYCFIGLLDDHELVDQNSSLQFQLHFFDWL